MTNTLSKMKELPFVSICTITFNRRPFFPYLKQCILDQTYQGNIEWIIIDDGTDPIEDCIRDLDFVIYYKYDTKLPISTKRNLSNRFSNGDILIYFDDDDYYPPERIEHAVTMLEKNPEFLIAGCNTMYIYFKDMKLMYSFGPYGLYHSTAATFAFKRELLEMTKFNEEDCLSEEKFFLKNYSIPLIQLDPLKTILVFRHIHNSFDKNELLDKSINSLSSLSNKTVDDFIKDEELKNFYSVEIDDKLLPYKEGEVSNKPDVIEYMKIVREQRKKMLEEKYKMKSQYEDIIKKQQIIQTNENYTREEGKYIYTQEYVDNLINKYEKIIDNKSKLINTLLLKIKEYKENAI
jgi:glycosyltransferase involved in cell wall biosynthesis